MRRRFARAPVHAPRRQRGNGLVFALLGLLVSALGTAALIQGKRLEARHSAGLGEATVLDSLRHAANDAIFDSLIAIQAGRPIAKGGVTVAPVEVGGEPVWRPTIVQLVAMGYLPSSWRATTSSLNDAPYAIEWRRVPTGCVAAACGIEGNVVLAGALVDDTGSSAAAGTRPSDGAVIGPILAHLGADAGVSLPTDPTHIEGFANTWTAFNPVAGQPPGVVAVRIGTASSTYGPFVRVGDPRDPDLAGNLTVAGDTTFGNGSTLGVFKSAVRIEAQPLAVRDAAGNACVTMRPDGVVEIHCTGLLDAVTGVFKDAGGQASTIAPTGLMTSGDVQAAGGFSTATVVAFGAANPDAIVVKAGDLFVRDALGTALLRIGADGDVTSAKDLVANGLVQAARLTLTDTVDEGDTCAAGAVAMMRGGGLATCQDARFRATTRYASLGGACTTTGQSATDIGNGDSLVCRGGSYASVSGLLSSRVYMASFDVRHGDFLPLSTALPNGCPATASAVAPQAIIDLLPQSDAMTSGNGVLNRNAQWTGSGWTISLTDGAGGATSSVALAEIACLYP